MFEQFFRLNSECDRICPRSFYFKILLSRTEEIEGKDENVIKFNQSSTLRLSIFSLKETVKKMEKKFERCTQNVSYLSQGNWPQHCWVEYIPVRTFSCRSRMCYTFCRYKYDTGDTFSFHISCKVTFFFDESELQFLC